MPKSRHGARELAHREGLLAPHQGQCCTILPSGKKYTHTRVRRVYMYIHIHKRNIMSYVYIYIHATKRSIFV